MAVALSAWEFLPVKDRNGLLLLAWPFYVADALVVLLLQWVMLRFMASFSLVYIKRLLLARASRL